MRRQVGLLDLGSSKSKIPLKAVCTGSTRGSAERGERGKQLGWDGMREGFIWSQVTLTWFPKMEGKVNRGRESREGQFRT